MSQPVSESRNAWTNTGVYHTSAKQ